MNECPHCNNPANGNIWEDALPDAEGLCEDCAQTVWEAYSHTLWLDYWYEHTACLPPIETE